MRNPLAFCLVVLTLFSSFTGRKTKLKLPAEFSKIPGGTFHFMVMPDSFERKTLTEFYMSKFEISNRQYREFYDEVSQGMSSSQKASIACDTLAWESIAGRQSPLVQYYYRHPAYNDYPVVNISYEGALKYCEWLEMKIGKVNPGFNIEVKLPSIEQWEYAAMGGRSQAMYPWGNFYLRNKKGEFLCNFKKVGDQAIYRNRETGKPEVHISDEFSFPTLLGTRLYTSSVKSYSPNDFGLFNMCGNAAEMIFGNGIAKGGSWNDFGGDIQIKAESPFKRPIPTVGFRPVIIAVEK